MRHFRYPSLVYSVGIHILLLMALIFISSKRHQKEGSRSEVTILLGPTHSATKQSAPSKSRGTIGSNSRGNKEQPHTSIGKLDLRPDFAKSFGKASGQASGQPSSHDDVNTNRDAQGLLHTDGQSLQAFDQLAVLINGHMDYPEMLAENGVQGMATLDLYFDHDARVDETRSRLMGDNRWIRGLFAKAARNGLEEWFRGMGGNLKRAQFRDQHFRADFVITYTNTHASELERNGENSYHLVRRQLVQTCLNPVAGGLDLACTAMRVAGTISSKVSSNYRIKFEALKDRLEQFDEIGLSGINQSILRRSET
ncbi:MAG: hypothetical protein ACJ763_15600 [Bdellovibrionia bacterium]